MSRTGNALIRGGIARSAAMAVTAITGVCLLPLVLHQLGDRLYGAWVLVGVALGYYGLLDLGLSSAVTHFVAQALQRHDRREADGIITSSLCFFSAAGLACLMITAGAALLCGRFIDDPGNAILFRNVILIMGTALAIGFPARGLLGVLHAHLRFDLVSLVEIVVTLTRAALFVVVLLQGGKLLALAVTAAALNVARSGAFLVLAQRIHGPIRLSASLVTRTRIRQLLAYGSFTFVAQVTDLLRVNTYPIIITGFLSLAAVAPFAVAERLRFTMVMFSAAILSNMTPVFSRQDAGGDPEALRRLYFFIYKIACYVGVFVVGMAVILGADFIERWVGAKHAQVVPIQYVLSAAAFVVIIQIPTMSFLYGTSRNHLYALTNMCEGIGTVILSIILIQTHGLIGAAFGATIAAVFTRLIISPWWVCRALHVTLLRYHVRYTLPNLVRPALLLALVLVASRFALAPNYLVLGMVGFVAFLLFVPYIFFVGFNHQERALLLRSVK